MKKLTEYKSENINVTGLNELLRGKGFELPPRARNRENLNGLVVLIKGKPGTGKSTLALQLTHSIVENTRGIEEFRKSASKYYSLEQKTEDITIKYASVLINRISKEIIDAGYEEYYKLKKNDEDDLLNKIRHHFFEIYSEKISKCLIDKSPFTIDIHKQNQTVIGKTGFSSNGDTANILEDMVNKINTEINAVSENIKKITFSKDSPTDKINEGIPYKYSNSPIFQVIDILNQIDDSDEIMPMVVIDGLNILGSDDIKRVNLHQIIDILRKKSLYTFIAYEPNNKDDDYLEYLVDMVINLRQHTIQEPITYWLNDLSISKARHQNAALGWHQYKIRDFGIEVFPSTHFQVHHSNSMMEQLNDSKISVTQGERSRNRGITNKASILEKIIPMKPGSFTVILGARATFKTTFTLDFLFSGAKNGEKGLLLSLIDNKESIIKNLEKCPRFPAGKCDSDCFSKLFHLQQRPGCITPSEFIQYLNERIKYSKQNNKDDQKIKRITFWDLTQIEFRFPLFANDPMFLPSLMDYFRKEKIAAIVMGSGNAKLTKAAAAMADNVLFCWRDKINDKINKEEINHIIKDEKLKIKITEDLKNKHEREYIVLYVDRCTENLGNEGKSLYLFSINDDNNIEIPDCNNTAEVDNYRLKKYGILARAQNKIDDIVRMQGIGD